MIREPAVAGYFYSNSPEVLRGTVGSLLQSPQPPFAAKAVISPHAGYTYSGAVAGAVFGAVQVSETVIILGPNHTGMGKPLAICPPGEWRTPLGVVSIDSQLTDCLLKECPSLVADLTAHKQEHAIEVQLPFLQARVRELRFAAICVGTVNYALLEKLGHALAVAVQSHAEPPLLIVSSDMNHYESAVIADRKDHEAIEQVLQIDPEGLYRVVREGDITMCGFAPAVAVLVACRDMGASQGRLIRYANSGEVSGDFESVVGYAGMAIL